MKKTVVTIFVISVMMGACSNNGEKAETKEAQDVELIETNETIALSNVSEDSYLDWRASHLGGISPRFGKVYVKDAEVLVNNGELTNAKVNIDMASLTVDNFEEGSEDIEKLKGHLLSEDFFKVENYPTSTFELTKIEPATGDYNSVLTGNLTILDTNKSITFKANVNVSDDKVTVDSEDFSIDRTEWNLTYNVEGTEGVPADYIISNDVGFTINLTVTK
jgi:polyisoprenoid-binding protein YceI